MMRVKYESGELDSNHKIIEGIRSTLEASPRNRARTAIDAVGRIDLDEDGEEGSLDQKINHICKVLDCTHERIGNEIVFTLGGTGS
jgi:hypothetical protein